WGPGGSPGLLSPIAHCSKDRPGPRRTQRAIVLRRCHLRACGQETEVVSHDLDRAPPPAGLLPAPAAETSVERDEAAFRQPRARLRLLAPRHDADEVGRVAARPVDREQERCPLLALPDLAKVDVGREVPDQQDDVHPDQRTRETRPCLSKKCNEAAT